MAARAAWSLAVSRRPKLVINAKVISPGVGASRRRRSRRRLGRWPGGCRRPVSGGCRQGRRLDRVDRHPGQGRVEGERDPGNQTAAAAGTSTASTASPAWPIGRRFPTDGALAGDDARIVIGFDDGRAAFLGQAGADFFADVAVAVIKNTSPPSAVVLATLIAGASLGMTMVAATPNARAAAATPCA